MLAITFNRLSEKFLFMSKTQVTSYEKLTQLSLTQVTPTSYHSYLVSPDIKSLYTRLFNVEGIKAVKKPLDNHPKRTVATKAIKAFVALILTLNNFIFNSRDYLQTKVCAIGTTIFMDHFEKKTYIPTYQRVFINLQIY